MPDEQRCPVRHPNSGRVPVDDRPAGRSIGALSGWLNSCQTCVVTEPPDGLPMYRVLTGPDDDHFCRRVSEALKLGYRLHEGPAVTHGAAGVIVAQALLWPAISG